MSSLVEANDQTISFDLNKLSESELQRYKEVFSSVGKIK